MIVDAAIKFFRSIRRSNPVKAWLEPETPETFPFTRWVTFGNHLYRGAEERCEVIFVDPVSGRRRFIVDNAGRILNFPGIEMGDWTKSLKSERSLLPVIRFRTDFRQYGEGRYIMIWEVQPDGRYWADSDGFGIPDDEEIRLYALIDHCGSFIGPFRIYSIGGKILHKVDI